MNEMKGWQQHGYIVQKQEKIEQREQRLLCLENMQESDKL